jgi:hypothetical protein
MSDTDKRKALEVLPSHYENRLFFAARNLAIEALLLRLENLMLRKGFDCAVEWSESSFNAPVIALKLKNPKPKESSWEFATVSLYLNRDTIQAPKDKASDCFYSLRDAQLYEYGRDSKYVLNFRAATQELHEAGHFSSEINKVNFPFDHDHHSSF